MGLGSGLTRPTPPHPYTGKGRMAASPSLHAGAAGNPGCTWGQWGKDHTMNRVFIVDLSGVGVPANVISEAVFQSGEGDDVVITTRPGPCDQEPTLRLDPNPGGGGCWWIWG